MSKVQLKLGQYILDCFGILTLMKKNNIGSIIIIIILLQLGVRGIKEIHKTFESKKSLEIDKLTNSPPPYFFELVEKIKKQNLDNKEIKNIIK